MEKIYVFGHKKPDTDSVAASISLCLTEKKVIKRKLKISILLNNFFFIFITAY